MTRGGGLGISKSRKKQIDNHHTGSGRDEGLTVTPGKKADRCSSIAFAISAILLPR